MKICQVCAVDFTLKHFLLPLIKAMEKQNWSVTALCSDGEFVDEIRRQGFEVRTANIERSLNPIKFAVSIFRMVAVFRSEKFDIVHVHSCCCSGRKDCSEIIQCSNSDLYCSWVLFSR